MIVAQDSAVSDVLLLSFVFLSFTSCPTPYLHCCRRLNERIKSAYTQEVQLWALPLLSPLQKMSQEFEIKRLSLEEQRDRLQQQLDNLKEELSAKINMANQEVQQQARPVLLR